jgi:hypothetical protein
VRTIKEGRVVMPEMNAHKVLTKLYEELRNLGETKKEVKDQIFSLAQDSDGHRTDYCHYYFDGVINRYNEGHCVFTHGHTDRTWAHLAGVDEAVMYGKIDWARYDDKFRKFYVLSPLCSLPEKETMEGITDEQVRSLITDTIKDNRLIRSWEGEISIRDGMDFSKWMYIDKPIPERFVILRTTSPTKIAKLSGINILLEKESSPEEIRAMGLEPTGYQEIFYKDDVVQYLVDHVKEVLSRPNE